MILRFPGPFVRADCKRLWPQFVKKQTVTFRDPTVTCAAYCEADGGRGCLVCGGYVKYTYRAVSPGPTRATLTFTHGCVRSEPRPALPTQHASTAPRVRVLHPRDDTAAPDPEPFLPTVAPAAAPGLTRGPRGRRRGTLQGERVHVHVSVA